MSENILNVRIKEKHDTESNWQTNNPVLLKGEIAFSSDKNNIYKVGDGISTWSNLSYAPSGTVTSVGVTAGDGISVSGSPITTSGTITVGHGSTSSQASVDNSGRTYIQDVTLDKFGHVIGLSSASETVTDTHRPIEVNDTQILGDNSTPLNLKAGTNVTLSNSGGDVTISAQGGGHTIQNDSGTALSQRPNLQFVGTYSEDDSTNSKTKVNIVRKMTKAQFDLLSADEKKGLIDTTDEPGGTDAFYSKNQTDALLSTKQNDIGLTIVNGKLCVVYDDGN